MVGRRQKLVGLELCYELCWKLTPTFVNLPSLRVSEERGDPWRSRRDQNHPFCS